MNNHAEKEQGKIKGSLQGELKSLLLLAIHWSARGCSWRHEIVNASIMLGKT
jgi:hypothetical protein